ncbi:Protein-lysine methyltransferase METTL21C [Linum perenne]
MANLEEDDIEETDPTKILLPPAHDADELESELRLSTAQLEIEKHYLHSTDSTLKIRQLPSEGLSFQLWPAATTLVNLLDRYVSDPTKSPLSSTLAAASNNGGKLRILEIGSGTGLVGIAAAATLGADVTVTDLPHVAPNLQFNVDLNDDVLRGGGGTVHVAPLRWGEADDVDRVGCGFDLVVASDVVYHDHLYDPLLKTLRLLLLERKTAFVMAHLRRWKKEAVFFKRARKSFDVEVLYVDGPTDGRRLGVTVYRFVAKGKKMAATVTAIAHV